MLYDNPGGYLLCDTYDSSRRRLNTLLPICQVEHNLQYSTESWSMLICIVMECNNSKTCLLRIVYAQRASDSSYAKLAIEWNQ